MMGEAKNLRQHCEYLRHLANQKFEPCRSTWIDLLRWALPHRGHHIQNQRPGERNNNHIVDTTHVLALRSYVAGFLEGNTSATRPWYRQGTGDMDVDNDYDNKKWLDKFTRRTLQVLSSSNFYHEAGQFYYDFGTVMTGSHYIEKVDGRLHFHTLVPGSYKVINNAYGEAAVLVIEMCMTVKGLVDAYVKEKSDWANVSNNVKKMYEEGNYTEMIDVCHLIKQNDEFDPRYNVAGRNRQWVAYTYEIGVGKTQLSSGSASSGVEGPPPEEGEKYLKIQYSRRKPFIVGKSDTAGNFEYGLKGPTIDALGTIKSLNKKAIGKDQALEQMLRPPLQGPASLRKSYVTTAPNSFVPLDPTSVSQKGLQPIFQVNPAIGELIQDVTDLRQMVNKIYYADFLLYLSSNPKTRTATETDAIVREQQLIIGPNLQSLNWTYNVPVVEFVADYVLYDDDDWILDNPIPDGLQGKSVKPQFISVFAQAQRAADLPAVDRYRQMIMEVGSLDPRIFDKANLDMMADIYEDRLMLPAGLNNPQGKVDAMREQALRDQQRQAALTETAPALAKAAKDLSSVEQ